MIFSRFFSPSHSSNDPDIRIKAIEKLSPQSPNERRLLHELAFNDEVAAVSLAALTKLNSFALWLKMSQIARNPKLVSAAQAQVECALIDGGTDISAKELKEYLLKTAPADQVVKCFPLMTELHSDVSFSLKLLERVDRSSFTQNILNSSPETSLKLEIIATQTDSELLQKVLKKCAESVLCDALETRLKLLAKQAERPIVLSRDVTLVLSKMLALLDKADYQLISEQRDDLNKAYQKLKVDFACLGEDEQVAFEQKFNALNDRIDSLLARLLPDWQASQQAAAHEMARIAADNAINEVKRQHKQLQGEQILRLTLGEVSEFQLAVENAEKSLAVLQAFESPSDQIESMLESYRHIWDRLPELQRQVEMLTEQLTTWRALLSNEEQAWSLSEIKSLWREQSKDIPVMPDFLQSQWHSLKNDLQKVEQSRKAEQQRQLKHCRKHINIINNLVEQGRFRAAMARFQRLEQDYQGLPQATQLLLNKRFEQTQEQISRLEGWQMYLAAPRKPELIEQAKLLLAEPATDVPARARSIKYLRQQWQTLGRTNQPEDDALNAQFDSLLESAFEPCRQYYAAIEQKQNEAALVRQKLINEVEALADEEITDDARYQQFELFKKQWQQAEQTDSERYKQLREDWDGACTIVSDKLSAWLKSNRLQKQNLINQVTALAEHDDINEAKQQAIQAQEIWKTLGPAGKRYESKLWFAFKAANDAVFSRVKQAANQRKAEQSAVIADWLTEADSTQAILSKGQLDEARERVQVLESNLPTIIDRASEKSLKSKLFMISQQIEQAIAERVAGEQGAQVEMLIAHLCDQPESDRPDVNDYSQLPAEWFNGAEPDNQDAWLKCLLMVEILLQTDTGEQDSSLRSTIQLQLMQTKLNGEALPDINDLIACVITGMINLSLNTEKYRQRLSGILVAALGWGQ